MNDWVLALAADRAALLRSQTPGTRDAAIEVLGEATTAWGIATAELVHADLVHSEADGELVLSARVRAGLEAAVLGLLMAIVAGGRIKVPAEGIATMRWDARQGTALDVLLRELWRSHSQVQVRLIEAMTSVVPENRLAHEIRTVSAIIIDFVDAVIDALGQVFEQESAAWGRHRSATIRRVVDEIVATGEAASSVDEVLGIRLHWHHVAAVLWPLPATSYPGWSSESAQWVHTVTEHVHARSTLIVPRTDGSTDVIWSTPTAPATEALRSLAPPDGFGAAFGFDGSGPAGFRLTMLSAHGLARAAGPSTTSRTWLADEHGALALMMEDPAAAAVFVHRILAGLDGSAAKDAALRATLLAFLEHQGSRVAAADELHVAPTTVAYRVQQAEARLQQPIAARRNNILAALLLAENFPHLLK